MAKTSPIQRLSSIAHSFGGSSARAKALLLEESEGRDRLSARDLGRLHDIVCFLRAYPDDAVVRRRVESLAGRLRSLLETYGVAEDSSALADTGFPGAVHRYEFSLPVLARMLRRFPECFEIDWDEFEDQEALTNALGLVVTSGECQALDDIRLDLRDWFEAAKPAPAATDLGFLLSLFDKSRLDGATRDHLWETCAVPIRYRLAAPGTGRCEVAARVERTHYQRREITRERPRLAAAIRRPLPGVAALSRSAGDAIVDVAVRALCARNLEIRTLSYGNPADVWLADCGRGLQAAFIGVVPSYRDPLECHYLSLLLKNGIPVAYGPATVSLGTCEMGLNLFPEFRGAEVRFVFPQFMRAMHHVLGARYFSLTSYGMGEDNPAAIKSGAFWFYRKLGFCTTNPAVESLALEEEARMREDPTYRSSPGMLRRLSHTEAYFDLSGGECRPLDLGAIGLAQSRFLSRVHGDDRSRAERSCAQRAARLLGQKSLAGATAAQLRAWSMLGPILCMISDVGRWSRSDKARLLRIVRAKAKSREIRADFLMLAHARFRDALRAMTGHA